MKRVGRIFAGVASMGLLLGGDVSAANLNVYVSRFWHNHQPLYWPEWNSNGSQTERAQYAWDSIVLKPTQNYGGLSPKQHPENNLTDIFGNDDRKASYQSRPRDSLAGINNNAGFAISYSGSLIDNVRQLGGVNQLGYGGGWWNGNREASEWFTPAGSRRMDLVGFTYHHSLGPLLPKEVFRKELQIFKQAWWKAWDKSGDLSDHSKGFFPTEMAFSTELVDVLADEGYEWAIVASHHLSRTCPTYFNQANPVGSFNIKSSPPNKADLLGPSPTTGWWFNEPNPGQASWNVSPFAYQLHKIKYVNPNTGAEKFIIAVPSDDTLSYVAGYSGAQKGMIDANISPHATDPSRPVMVMPSTDGDNAWGGGFSSWLESTPAFFSACAADYKVSTPQDMVNAHGSAAPVTHIEDGAWIFPESDYGSPYYLKWIEPPLLPGNAPLNDPNRYPGTKVSMETPGFALKFFSYAPLMAGANWVITAEQMWKAANGPSSVQPWKIQAPYDWNGVSTSPNIVERAWHIYLKGLDSGFNYYGGLGNDDEVKPALATKRAIDMVNSFVTANITNDLTEPTVLRPQRFPWNPGGYTFGWFNSYGTGTNAQYLKKMPSDFYIWTHAYDVSGVTSINVKVRLDNDGINTMANNQNETYSGGGDVGSWISIPMTKRVLPKTRVALNAAANNAGEIDYFVFDPAFWPDPQIADYYFAKITDSSAPSFRGKLLDYYIEANDGRGNVHKSEIQHVFVENDGGESSNPSIASFSNDPNDCSPLTVTYIANNGPLSNSTPVKLWVSFTGGAPYTSAIMTHNGGGTSVFTFATVTNNAPSITVYFQSNDESITDNRSGLNWSATIRDCDAPVGPSSATFSNAPACQAVTVDYRPNSNPLQSATQVFAHVGFNNWSTVLASQPMTKISNNLWRISINPLTNATQLDLVFNNGAATWDNNGGADWHFALNVCEGEPLPTGFSITNPASDIVVGNATLTFNVQGIGESVIGDLRWTNTLTGGSGTTLAGLYWTIGGLPLGVGTNVITVSGTNVAGSVATNAMDNGASAVYSDGWTDTDNGGFGFGGWLLYVSTNNSSQAGRFMANTAAVSIGVPAWGLYANSDQLSEAKRYLTNALAVDQTFSVSFENGFLDNGAGAGVALQNSNGDTLWEFFFNGGDTNYSISGGTTDIGFTTNGISVEFTLTGPTNYNAKITPLFGSVRNISGNLQANTNSAITLFRAWNNHAGSDSVRDVFFNNLKITGAGSGQGTSTSDTVNIVRETSTDSNGDGIPDSWYNQYGMNPATPGLATNDTDNDGYTNWDEYIYDTNPTNNVSYNTSTIEYINDTAVMDMRIESPTSTGRLYDVYWATSLFNSTWTPMNLNVSGNPDNSPIMLKVTNDAALRYYRTGAKLPGP